MLNYTIPAHDVLKALADPIRLRLVNLLSGGEICVCELQAILEMPQSTISRHMSRLRSAGLVKDRRDGKWVHYRLAGPEHLGALSGYLESLKQQPVYSEDWAKLKARHRIAPC